MQQNTVAYSEGQPRDLEEAAILRDAISDLPAVISLFNCLFLNVINALSNVLNYHTMSHTAGNKSGNTGGDDI